MVKRDSSAVRLRNLAQSCTVEDVARLCVTFGEVRFIDLHPLVDHTGQDPAHHDSLEAIVTFEEAADASEAVDNLDGAEVHERYVEATLFRPRR